MDIQSLWQQAKPHMGEYCHACPICNGKACQNAIPGPGAKGSGTMAIRNFEAWTDYDLVMDAINDVQVPDTHFDLFGKTLLAPIIIGPIGAVASHYSDLYDEKTYNEAMVCQAQANGIIAMTGDGLNDAIMQDAAQAIRQQNGYGIPTIKPWDQTKVKEKIDLIASANPIAWAMDVDASGLPFLKTATSKSVSDLKELVSYTQIPLIVKGVLSAKTAQKALEAGAKAILISNHGGRVLDHTRPTAHVIEEVKAVVQDQALILVDGGIRDGQTIFKALALGADGVVIARPFVTALYGGGLDVYTQYLIEGLQDTMKLCGAKSLASIDRSMIYG